MSQYKSQFNNPGIDESNNESENIFNDNRECELNDIIVNELDIQNAIDENSSAGQDDVPALLLIKTK